MAKIFNIKFIGVVLLTLILLVGCSDENSTETSSPSENNTEGAKELKIAYNAQPPSLDIHLTTANATKDITRPIYETLVTVNNDWEIKPVLAENYEVSEDGKKITFNLREGIKFHNGKEMTADDVIASMDRWRNLSSVGAPFREATIEAVDPLTVTITFDEPNVAALSVITAAGQFPGIMPKEVIEAAGPDGVDEYIGTGPYQFVEWKQDQHIHLTKFDDYNPRSEEADGLAGKREALVDDIFIEFVKDTSTRVAGIETGQYDIIASVPYDNVPRLEGNPDVNTHVSPNGLLSLVFNKKEGIFSNEKMRQAANAAIDKEAVLISAYSNENFYRANNGLMQPEQVEWYSSAASEKYKQNVEEAKQLMDEAGYNGEEITILTTRDYDDHYNAAIILTEQLKAVGMNINLQVYDWATVVEKRQDPSAYDAFTTGFNVEPHPSMYVFMNSAMNWPGWTNSPEFNALFDQLNATTSKEEIKNISEELQKEFWDYLPIIKFGDRTIVTATRSNVKGFEYLNGLILWNIEKE